MALSFPRVSITVNDDRGLGTQGELSGLSLGLGIHQAWVYSAMFGTTTIFQTGGGTAQNGDSIPSVTFVFLISIIVFAATLFTAAATDQKFLRTYTRKQTMIVAAALTFIGTLSVFAAFAPGIIGIAATAFAGVATGIGSAFMLIFWGVAYSRDSSASIVVNTAVSTVIAVAIYSLVLHIVSAPYSGALTACLPLLELPLLWQLTPESYAIRHAVPIFNPLPVKKVPFSLRLSFPVLLFGFALGALRSVSTQIILPSSDLTTQLLALFAGGAATILLLITVLSIDKRSHWDFLFRPIVPFIAVTLFFLPSLALDNSMVPPLVLLTGYMCFESLMWVFFGELAQELRLSPIFVFGVGRGCLALGSLVGSLLVADPHLLDALTPFGENSGAVVVMFTMVLAYALLPRVRDIKHAIGPTNASFSKAIASMNLQNEQAHIENQSEKTSNKAAETSPILDSAKSKSENPPSIASGDPRRKAGSQKAAADVLPLDEGSRKSGWFRGQCEEIANRYLLSRRETEVMFMLAKGYNAAYIQDQLYISKSTAKTHISHIYRKLNIHNQQELLAMIGEGREPRE